TDAAQVSIADSVPLNLRFARLVAVFGKMTYTTDSGDNRTLLFKSRVSLVMPGPGAPAPPTYQYDTFLEAGKSGYVKSVPISQEIHPGAADHFLLRIGTDKSARFQLEITFLSADGTELPGGSLVLDEFVPRSYRK